MSSFQKDIQAYNTLNNTYNNTTNNPAYNSKLCFDDLLKISQRDFNTRQFNTQQFNTQQPFNTQFNTQQLFNTQFNNQQLNIDASCANCMSSLFNLSPFESVPPTTNILTTDIPTTDIKIYDEIEQNIEKILIPSAFQNGVLQKNMLQKKVFKNDMLEQKPIGLEEDTLQQNTLQQNTSQQNSPQQNLIQQKPIQQSNSTQNDVQLWLPQQYTHNYKSVMSFVDKVLEHFNALFNLNKMIPKHRYKREYIFDVWKQTIFCAKQGLIPLPYPLLHKSYIKDQNQNTIAMILASQKIYVPKHWLHKPTLTNKFGETVAIIYAKQGIIPPQEWKHAFNLVCPENGQTVFMSLVQNYCRQQCSKQEYSKQGYSKQQQSQQQSKFEQWLQNIPSYWIHSDEIIDQYGQTVSSILSSNGLKVK